MKRTTWLAAPALLTATLVGSLLATADTPSALSAPLPMPTAVGTYDPGRSLAPLVSAVSPAVVSIEVTGSTGSSRVPPGFPGFPQQHPSQGQGSGFITSADGLVLTNHHVVQGATSIAVKLQDGTKVAAEVLGSDAEIDIALLQLPTDRAWPYVALGSSEDLRVGDRVVAMGNGLGLGTTVTTGIVSGKGRVMLDAVHEDFLQTDAAINPGNSGGPLFTLEGEVVGVNTAIIAGANTVGFAVPIDMVSAVVDDLRRDGRVSRGFFGVTLQPIDPLLVKALGLDAVSGALVSQAHPDTPAAKAGVQAGDVLTKVDGIPVVDVVDAVKRISQHRPGEVVTIELLREGQRMERSVTLTERPTARPTPELRRR